MHGAGGLPSLKSLHPVLNLQVTTFGCPDTSNRTCPRWRVSVQSTPSDASIKSFDLGHVDLDQWDDWVLCARFSPRADVGYLAVWRNGVAVLPNTSMATAYNDTRQPYVKFGVYKGDWKGRPDRPHTATWDAISYGAIKVGDENSSFGEVSTAQPPASTQTGSAPPHLLLVVGDDMGSNDVGYADPTVPTPKMNALARDGVRLSALYTWNWCAPSRASLLTGRYAPHHGFEFGGDGPEDNGDVHVLSTEFTLLPAALKRLGYRTVMAGK